MTRRALPARRQLRSVEAEFGNIKFNVSVGFNARGNPKEVFADGVKQGSDMAATIADSCVVISVALQFGALPCGLAKSLGCVPDFCNGTEITRPASPIGVILDAIIEAGTISDLSKVFDTGAAP